MCVAAKFKETGKGNISEHEHNTLTSEDKQESQAFEGDEPIVKTENKALNRNHKCSTCKKCFPTRAHLKGHEVTHVSERPYQCTVCGQSFKRKNALNKHMRIYHPDGPDTVECSCGKVFASTALMEKHKENSGQHRLLVCGECGAPYKTQEGLDSHLMLHRENQSTSEGSSWPYTCHICQDRLSSRMSLNHHVRDTHSTNIIHCPDCNKAFKTEQLLRLHRLRKHTAGDREFLCSMCSKVFHVLKDLRRHIQTHNTAGARECSVCHSKFKSDPKLRSHMKTHSQGKPYDCSICLFPFSTLEELVSHLQSCHSIDDVGHDFSETWNRKCLVCGQVFLRRSVLAHHMKSHFEPEGTQLLVLEDTGMADSTGTSERQVPSETSPLTRQLRDDKTEGGEQAEVNSTRSTNVYSHETSTVAGSKQATVSAAQTTPVNNQYCKAVENEVTTTLAQREEDGHSSDPTQESKWEESNVETLKEQCQVMDEGPAASISSSSAGDTRYICEACSLVLTDMEELKLHLLTCYKEESSDECFVVFEVDDGSKI